MSVFKSQIHYQKSFKFYNDSIKDYFNLKKNKNIFYQNIKKEIFFKKQYYLLKKKYPDMNDKKIYFILNKCFYKKKYNNNILVTENSFFIDFHFI